MKNVMFETWIIQRCVLFDHFISKRESNAVSNEKDIKLKSSSSSSCAWVLSIIHLCRRDSTDSCRADLGRSKSVGGAWDGGGGSADASNSRTHICCIYSGLSLKQDKIKVIL